MKKYLLTLLILSFSVSYLSAQVNFSENVASIIYSKCTSCHRPGEIGPMPFTNYQEVSAYASMIGFVTQSGYMPPWKADKDYSRFLDERILTAAEIQTIQDWVSAGAPQGNPALAPPLPNFPSGSQLGTPDLVVSFAQPFVHFGNNQDQYQVFVLPTGLTENKKVKAIEFRPGNASIAHHAIIAMDTTMRGETRDLQDPRYGYSSFGGFGFQPNEDNWYGWAPGTQSRFFPSNIGKNLWKNSKLLVQMHYAPSNVQVTDSSSINIFFDNNNQVQRNLISYPISPLNLLNGPFFIPANTTRTFHGRYLVNQTVTLVNVLPHMHLIGKDWEVYAVTPQNDTINIIKIPEWDFNWQGMYFPRNLIKIPAGSYIHAFASYDNTAQNPSNPNNPPQGIGWGENTSDEMYVCYIGFVPYQTGDELLDLTVGLNELNVKADGYKLFPAYPNPAKNQIQIGFNLPKAEKVSIRIFSMDGKLVHQPINQVMYKEGFNTQTLELPNLANGNYLIRLETTQFADQCKLTIY